MADGSTHSPEVEDEVSRYKAGVTAIIVDDVPRPSTPPPPASPEYTSPLSPPSPPPPPQEIRPHWLMHPLIIQHRHMYRFHVRFIAHTHYDRQVFTAILTNGNDETTVRVSFIDTLRRQKEEDTDPHNLRPRRPKNNSNCFIIEGENTGEMVTLVKGFENSQMVQIKRADKSKSLIDVSHICGYDEGQ